MEKGLYVAATTFDGASKVADLISSPLSSINAALSWIRNQLEKLKTSDDTKTRIIDTVEFMLRTLDNIKIYKRHHDLENICEQLQIAKRLCDQIIQKDSGHKLPRIGRAMNASAIKEDLERVEKNVTMANEKLGICLSMLITEHLEENHDRAKEMRQLQENPDRGIYFGVDDINLPPIFELSAKTCTVADDPGLELSWVPLSGNNTTVEKYELLYDKDQNACKMINDGNCTKVTLSTSLIKPGKPYSMEIRGINRSGAKGKWSKTIVATISKLIPSKPTISKILIVSPKEALVTVQPPIISCDTESTIKHWLVQYTRSNTNNWKEITTTDANSEITVKNLKPDEVYHFRVCAVNAEGTTSKPSDLVTKNTKNVDPLQPVKLHLSSEISYSVLIINWQMPKRNLEFITYYEVRKREERAFVHDDLIPVEDKKAISYKFEKLKSKTKYLFQVRACNDNGKSNWAEIFGETCSIPGAIASSLVAKLPIGKKDAKNKDGAYNSIFYVDINDSNTGGESNKDDEHSSDDEDTYHDALASSLVAKFDMKEGKSKDSAIDQSDDDDNTHVEDKTDKDNNNTNKHNKSVEPNQDSNYTHDDLTVKEFRERFTNNLSHRPTKGTQ